MRTISKFSILGLSILLLSLLACDDNEEMETTTTLPAISGYYTLDTNGDGIQEPVQGHTLRIYENWSSPNCYCGTDLEAVTDEDGYYIFENICIIGDSCKIWVIGDDSAIPTPSVIRTNAFDTDAEVDGDEYDGGSGDSCCIIVTLREDELDSGNNFTGTTYNTTISGIVEVDNNNDGIADAPANDVSVTVQNTIGYYIKTICDNNGNYEINGLPPGTYFLYVVYNNYNAGHTLPDSFSGANVINAEDLSPDPDGSTPTDDMKIIVVLEDGEVDADNNFVVEPE